MMFNFKRDDQIKLLINNLKKMKNFTFWIINIKGILVLFHCLKFSRIVLFFSFILYSFSIRSQDFITTWAFTRASNYIHFRAETEDTVKYTWKALPWEILEAVVLYKH